MGKALKRSTIFLIRFESRCFSPGFFTTCNRFAHRCICLHVFHPNIIHDPKVTGAKSIRHRLGNERFGFHETEEPLPAAASDMSDHILDDVGELGCPERQAPNPVVGHHVDEIAATK